MSGARPESAPAAEQRRLWPFSIAIAVCLFVGFWGWLYQGYTEDAGRQPIESWPLGAGGYLGAGVLALVAPPVETRATTPQLVVVAVCLLVVLAAAAVASLEASERPLA